MYRRRLFSKKKIIQAVANNAQALKTLPESMQDDVDIIFAEISCDGSKLVKYGSRFSWNDLFIMEALKTSCSILSPSFINESYLDRKKFMLTAVKNDANAIIRATPRLCANREIILAAIFNSGNALKYASADLCADKEIVLAAVKRDGTALRYASESLRADKEVVLAAVRCDGTALQYSHNALHSDIEIVMAAVRNNGVAIASAARHLRGSREVVLEAVKNNGVALRYSGHRFRADREIVLHAARTSKKACILDIVDPEFHKDKEIILVSLRTTLDAYDFIDDSLRNDPDIIKGIMISEFLHDELILKQDEEYKRCAEIFKKITN